MIEKEEQTFMEHMMQVIEHLGMEEQQFMMMHQTYMSNPETQQDLMQAQMMPPTPEGEVPKLSRQETKELFFYTEEKKMESMKKLMAGGMKRAMRPQDPMEQMFEMMVEQCKLQDAMFFEKNVEEEDFNAAMVHHNLMNDREVQKKLMDSMQKLGMGQGMGGGMGGF